MASQAPNEVCFVFDDVHEIATGSQGAAVLSSLVNDLPGNGHVVLASRDPVPVSTSRLAVGGYLERLAEADLAFEHSEIEHFAAIRGKGLGVNRDQLVVIPFQVYRKNFFAPNDPLDYFIKARGGVEGVDASIDETRAFLRALRHTAWKDPDPFGFLTQDQLQELWRQISTATFVLLTLIASVSLGVGGIVIMNIMLVSVAERTQEIGVRLALGAKKRDIRRQFLLEAAILSTAGGVIGVMLGSLVALAVKSLSGFPAQITPGILLLGISLATVVGLLAGFLPARRASELPVIDALRAE